MGGLAPGELTAIQCKNIPDYLNDRTVLEKHFGQFVKVRRVMTRRNKKMAILHFFDHVSTAREQLEIRALGCPLYQTPVLSGSTSFIWKLTPRICCITGITEQTPSRSSLFTTCIPVPHQPKVTLLGPWQHQGHSDLSRAPRSLEMLPFCWHPQSRRALCFLLQKQLTLFVEACPVLLVACRS